MKDKKVYKIVASALFAAVICLATALFPIKLMHGFVNAGDGFIIIAGMFMGGIYGGLAAAIGSAEADILAGYVLYAPATFVIKGLMAVLAAFVYKRMKKGGDALKIAVCSVCAEIVMVGGYFLFECVAFGFPGAAADVAGNMLQAAAGIVIAFILGNIIERTPALKKYLQD